MLKLKFNFNNASSLYPFMPAAAKMLNVKQICNFQVQVYLKECDV